MKFMKKDCSGRTISTVLKEENVRETKTKGHYHVADIFLNIFKFKSDVIDS